LTQRKLINKKLVGGLGIICVVLAASLFAIIINERALSLNYSILQTNYQNLASNYASLNLNCSNLQVQYNSLQTSYQTLQGSYSLLQTQYSRYVSNYQRLQGSVNQRWDHNDLERFITPSDPAVAKVVYQVTGGSKNQNQSTLQYWADIKAMYDWVVNNIHYRNDSLTPMLPNDPSGKLQYIAEVWQFPNETLNMKEGDCKDMTVLLCSMIRYYNSLGYQVECIVLSSSTVGHVAVQLPVSGSQLVILDPALKYYTHSILGYIVPNDITTEINNWLNYVRFGGMPNDVYVCRVFSDYIDINFASTKSYLTWMYSR
jgi:hypothetical protein